MMNMTKMNRELDQMNAEMRDEELESRARKSSADIPSNSRLFHDIAKGARLLSKTEEDAKRENTDFFELERTAGNLDFTGKPAVVYHRCLVLNRNPPLIGLFIHLFLLLLLHFIVTQRFLTLWIETEEYVLPSGRLSTRRRRVPLRKYPALMEYYVSRYCPELSTVLKGIYSGLQSLGYICILLVLLIYIYAVAGKSTLPTSCAWRPCTKAITLSLFI